MTHELRRCISVPISLFVLTILPAQDWNLRTPTPSPAGATLPRMAFDIARGRAVLFGGWDAPVGNVVFQDTWEWDGTTWTQRAPAFVPTERESHVMAYDLQRGRTVMWGGQDFNFNLLTATLEWDGTDWAVIPVTTTPSGRLRAGMAFDIARGRTVMFGGEANGTFFDETWEYDGTNWSQVMTPTLPPTRSGNAMVYDQNRSAVLSVGGENQSFIFNRTWSYDGTDWSLLTFEVDPPARVRAGMVFDTQRSRVVLFGGADGVGVRSDTWELDGTRWYQVTTVTPVAPNTSMGMAYDPIRGQTIVAGGFRAGAAVSDTWEYGTPAPLFRTFGLGCAGSNGLVPRLSVTSMPALGGTLTLQLSDLPNITSLAFFVTALSSTTWNGNPLPVDLTSFGLNGCTGYTSVDVVDLVGSAGGTATASTSIPNNPALAGLVVFHQAMHVDPATVRSLPGALSNAAESTLR